MHKSLKFLLLLSLVLGGLFAYAEEEVDERELKEARLQQKFRDDMGTIVDDLNNGSFDRLVTAINENDMLDRIFGLRLIDQRVKRDFREDMKEKNEFPEFIEAAYKGESKDGMRARLLLVESRGDRGRAVVRFDMAHFQFNYIEYELKIGKWNRMYVVDWKDYLWGHQFSDRVGLSLVQGQPNKNAVRKLIDFPNVREQQVFQVMEVLKAARDYDFDRFFEIYDSLDVKLQRQRDVLVAGLDATRIARKRRSQRKILISVAKHYPNDPLFALSLLDYYFPDKQFEKAYDSLIRMKKTLRIDDAVTNARLSSTTLVLGQLEGAIALAEKAIQQEPDLELAWWAALRARVAAENYVDAIVALEQLRTQFGHSLDPEALAKDPSLKQFSRSDEYKSWFVANNVDQKTADIEGGDPQ